MDTKPFAETDTVAVIQFAGVEEAAKALHAKYGCEHFISFSSGYSDMAWMVSGGRSPNESPVRVEAFGPTIREAVEKYEEKRSILTTTDETAA